MAEHDPALWPDVNECHWPAPSLVAAGHTCAQCDGSHEHQWVAGAPTPYGGAPVRCRICGGRKCDVPACRLRRHHREDHDEF